MSKPEKPNPSVDNPFLSPEDAFKKGLKYVAEAAEKINAALAEGARTFKAPIGIAKRVATKLRELGWTVEVKACLTSLQGPDDATNYRMLYVTHPSDALDDEVV